MMKQYRRNPKGFAFIRQENLKIPNTSLSFKFKECVHYVSSSMICKNKDFIKKASYKGLTIAALPIGLALYGFVMYNTRGLMKS